MEHRYSLPSCIPLCSALAFQLALCSAALAQKPVEHSYLIELSGMPDRSHEKVVISAIKDQDPNALISVALAIQQVKVRAWAEIDPQQLAQAIAPWGISIVHFNPLWPLLIEERSLGQVQLPGFPNFIDTGHPEEDAADYQQRKLLWIGAHPDLYPPSSHGTQQER